MGKGKKRKKKRDKEESNVHSSVPGVPMVGSRELKFVYSPRATSKCQKHKEVGFSPKLVPPNPRVVNGRVV